MNDLTARALGAIGSLKIGMAFRSIMPTAPMTGGELDALHVFSQMWSDLWGIALPLNHASAWGGQLSADDIVLKQEDENVR